MPHSPRGWPVLSATLPHSAPVLLTRPARPTLDVRLPSLAQVVDVTPARPRLRLRSPSLTPRQPPARVRLLRWRPAADGSRRSENRSERSNK